LPKWSVSGLEPERAAKLKEPLDMLKAWKTVATVDSVEMAIFTLALDKMAQTQSGQAAIASEKLGEAMESVGRIINNVAIVVLPAITGAFADFVTFLTANVGPAIAFVQEHMEVFGPIIAAPLAMPPTRPAVPSTSFRAALTCATVSIGSS
jgi:hypothetical protein